jgi:hypothetical protein
MLIARAILLVVVAVLPALSQQGIGLAVSNGGNVLRATTAAIAKDGQWTWVCSVPCTGFDYNANDDIAYAVSDGYIHALSGNGVLLWRTRVSSDVTVVAPVYDSFLNVVWLAHRTLNNPMAVPFSSQSVNALTGVNVAVPSGSVLSNTSISSSDRVFRILVKGELAYALSVIPAASSPIRIYCLRGCGISKWSVVSPTKSYSSYAMPGYNGYHVPAALLADGGLVFAEIRPFSLDTPRVIYRINPGWSSALALTSIPAPPLSASTVMCGTDQGQTTWPNDFWLADLVPNGSGFDYFGVAARRGMWGSQANSPNYVQYVEIHGHYEGGQCGFVSNWKGQSTFAAAQNPVPRFAFASVSTGCGYSLRPETVNIASAGGASMSVTVSNANQNAIVWKAASYPGEWFSLGGCQSGVIEAGGSKVLQYTATENTSANPRTGVLRFGPETLNLNQAGAASTFSVSPTTVSVPSTTGSGSVSVAVSPADTSWIALSNSPWLTVSPNTIIGSSTLNYSYSAANTLASRTGTIAVGGQTVTVTQDGVTGSLTLSTVTDSAPAVGAAAKSVTVLSNASDLAWSASSNSAWLTISSGASMTGSGAVTYTVSANTSVNSRTGTLTIGGQTFTVTQSGVTGSVTLTPTTDTAVAAGATGKTVTVTSNAPDFAWTAASNAAWLTVTAGASATGSGTVTFNVAANTSANSRTGTLTIGGQTFTVTQSGVTRAVTLAPTTDTAVASGATGKTVTVTSNAPDFAWTATSNVTWLTITAGASTTGSGLVTYSVSANPSASSRTGTLTIGGQPFTVTQSGQTTATTVTGISPSPAIVGQLYTVSYTVTASSGAVSGNVTVSDGTATKSCPATAGQCTLSSSTTGTKTITVTFAGDASLQGSSGTRSLTVNAPVAVQSVALEQMGGTNGRPQLQFTAAHPVSAASIPYTQFLITRTALDARNACYVSYDTVANVFYLLSDDMTTWFGLLGGTGNTVGNSQCTIYGAASGATKVGQLTRTNLDVSFRGGFGGTKSVYQLAGDSNGGNSGWQLMGTWTDSGDPNVLEITSLTPSAAAGASGVVTANVRKGDGVSNIAFVQFVMNAGLNGFNACFIHYDRASNVFFLLKDDASGWFGLVGGSPAQVANSQCVLQGVGSGGTSTTDTLSINYNLQFKAPFNGSRNIYLQAVDNTGVIQSWKQAGTWSVSGATLTGAGGTVSTTSTNRGGKSLDASAAPVFESPRQYRVIRQGDILLVGAEENDPASPASARQRRPQRVAPQ